MNSENPLNLVTCPLCQHSFDTAQENCHTGCPVGSHCHAVKCPRCNYEFVEHSSLVSFFGKFFGKKKVS